MSQEFRRPVRPGPVRLAAFCLAALGCSPVLAGEPALDLRAAATYHSNLGNAEPEANRQEDLVFEFDAVGDYRLQIGENSGLVFKLGVETRKHVDTTDLDAITGMASLGYVLQPWRGFTAPWFALFGDFRWREHDQSDIRDGALIDLGAVAGKRFTDRISTQLRYEYRHRKAVSDRVFDLNRFSLSGVVDYRFSDTINTYARYAYSNGGLVTSAPRNPKFRGASRAAAMDPAFGRGILAWRLDGHANELRLGGKYSLTKRTAVDAGVSYAQTDASNDNKWNTWRTGVSVVHRFK
jgi:hypothetical protein